MSITGYRNSRDSVGRPALLGLARKPGRAVHLSARQIHAWYGIVTTLFCWTCEVYYARAVLVCLILFRTFAPFCGVLVFWAFSYNVPALVVPCLSPSRLLCWVSDSVGSVAFFFVLQPVLGVGLNCFPFPLVFMFRSSVFLDVSNTVEN